MKEPNYIQIAEKYFNKKLSKDEVVHHIDGNQNNNDPENLVIMKRSQHSRIHASLFCALDEWQRKISRKLCNSCYFVKMYDELNIANTNQIDENTSAWLVGISIGSEAKPVPVNFIHRLYKSHLDWKTNNNHDCYKNKNTHIVEWRQ